MTNDACVCYVQEEGDLELKRLFAAVRYLVQDVNLYQMLTNSINSVAEPSATNNYLNRRWEPSTTAVDFHFASAAREPARFNSFGGDEEDPYAAVRARADTMYLQGSLRAATSQLKRPDRDKIVSVTRSARSRSRVRPSVSDAPSDPDETSGHRRSPSNEPFGRSKTSLHPPSSPKFSTPRGVQQTAGPKGQGAAVSRSLTSLAALVDEYNRNPVSHPINVHDDDNEDPVSAK